jgi:RNA 3'-terminal phosphate cyclase (ATP)
MITGTEVKLENIRAGRQKPGLMRQHLACVNAAKAICNAQVSGAKAGSTSVMFKPGAIQAGDYEFSVGTAGSTMLIFQTVLPALIQTDSISRLSFHGGTHNMLAPSYDFVAEAMLAVLKPMGIQVEMKLKRHGFYPQGGGQWSALIHPAKNIKRLKLIDAGDLIKQQAVITSSNLPEHIALREINEIKQCIDWSDKEIQNQLVRSMGSGNIVSLRLYYQNCTEVIECVGKIGVSAERVARSSITDLKRYRSSKAVIGEHLADQLMLPMAIGKGGVFRTLKPSQHSWTNREVIHQFIDKRFKFEKLGKDYWEIRL